MSGSLNLTVKTAHDELDRITETIEAFAERDEWPPDLLYRVQLVLEEWNLNVMDYGHDDDQHDIDIALVSEGNSVTIEIVDGGRPFDPLTEAPAPDLTSSIGERRVGGLGVFFMRTLMDDVQYRRESGKNRLMMVTRKVK